MGTPADADRIQREREERKDAERLRFEKARRERERVLARMSDRDAGPAEEPEGAPKPERPRRSSSRPRPDESNFPPPPVEPPAPRTARQREEVIGGPIRSEAVRRFLAVDPTEGFDVQALNILPLGGLLTESSGDPELARVLLDRVDALLRRVKQESDDPLSVGAFLREQVLLWFRTSAGDGEWSSKMSARWAGLFADSRVSGGRLQPWLNLRLASLHAEVQRSGQIARRLRRAVRRDRSLELTARTPGQRIQAEVAQAILDDLAGHPRSADGALPLVRLSELAVRLQVPTVNDALALLFSSSEAGPFVVLHPNRYPDCDELEIRPPQGAAAGAALAYALGPGRGMKRGASRTVGGRAGGPVDGASPPGEAELDVDGSTVWESEAVGPDVWPRLVDAYRHERRRLEAPPKDFRTRAAFESLKSLLLDRPEFRKEFLAVRWRGRPAGPALLAALLQKGSYAPEVATDHEYLEAELNELTGDDPAARPAEGTWTVGSWTIRREGNHTEGFRYRAERGAAPPPASA